MKKSMILALILPMMMISFNIFAPEPLVDKYETWAKGDFSKLPLSEQRAVKDVLEAANRFWRDKKWGKDDLAEDAKEAWDTAWSHLTTKAEKVIATLPIKPNTVSDPAKTFEVANAYLMAALDVILAQAGIAPLKK